MSMVEVANAFMAPMAAMQTKAAINPYSIAVAPLSSSKNHLNDDVITAGRSPIGCCFKHQSTPAFNELLKPQPTIRRALSL